MPRTLRAKFSIATTTAAVGLAGVAGLLSGQAGAAVRAPGAAAVAATPTLRATATKQGITLAGPRTFRAGRVALSLKSVKVTGEIEVAALKKGYTFSDLASDLRTFGASNGPNGPTKAGIAALDRAASHVTLYGGLVVDPGKSLAGTIVLPRAGTYYAYNDLNVPSQPVKLTVTGPEVNRAAAHATATVTAMTDERFGGAATLPASGTITFRNTSTDSPHFLTLQHVKAGTTRAQVLASLNSSGPPSFARPGDANTDAVSPGQAMTLTYHLPKGEYVELCFFPDLKTGIPHAFMGMIRIVHLK